jgi:hypothetical protein
MSDFNQARFKLLLKFGQLSSGKCIQADMFHQGRLCTDYTADVILPTRITLVVHGKDMANDTTVDVNGKILEDLYVKITGVYLDGFDLGQEFLYKKINFITKDGTLNTPYLGFNGRVEFDLDQITVFDQVMEWKNVA